MAVLTGGYIHCPGCSRTVERAGWDCPFCGGDIAWMLEERRLAKQYIRYLSASVLGGVLLSMAILTPLGALSRYVSLLVPVWVALAALAGVLWLVAGHFQPPSCEAIEPDHKT